MKKFNILKTFDIFNSEAISILKDKIINLIFIETENFFIKDKNEKKQFLSKIIDDNKENSGIINANTNQDDSIQLSIIGTEKVYNLLSYTLNKYKKI